MKISASYSIPQTRHKPKSQFNWLWAFLCPAHKSLELFSIKVAKWIATTLATGSFKLHTKLTGEKNLLTTARISDFTSTRIKKALKHFLYPP